MSRRAVFRLMKYLGPFLDAHAVPPVVERRTVPVPGPIEAPMWARVYRPIDRRAIRTVVVAHGLHPEGPDDKRFDRFLRALAHAGFLVVCPVLPTLTSLIVAPTVTDEFRRAFRVVDEMREKPAGLPLVFSVSFGSLPALTAASDDDAAMRMSAVVTFGGYANFRETIRYALGEVTHEGAPEKDPLNLPVLALNLLDALVVDDSHRQELNEHWNTYVRATWGRPEMKAPARFHDVAHTLAHDIVDDSVREMFLQGCGVVPGFAARADAALARRDTSLLDPRPLFARIKVPVHAIHGVDDDVIPHTELASMRAAFPESAKFSTSLTGLYAHTHTTRPALRDAPLLLSEFQTLQTMARILVDPERTLASLRGRLAPVSLAKSATDAPRR